MPYKNKQDETKHRKKYYLEHREHIIQKATEWTLEHPDRRLETKRKWNRNNKEKVHQYYFKLKENSPEKLKTVSRRYREKNPERRKESLRKWRAKLQKTVYEHYGGSPCKCNCCGESEYKFLTLDHINNDGWKDKKKGLVSTRLWKWIIDNNFPKEFQILCANCNFGKSRNGGICPHQDTMF